MTHSPETRPSGPTSPPASKRRKLTAKPPGIFAPIALVLN